MTDKVSREKWLDAATLRQAKKIKTEGEVTRDEWIMAVYYEKYRAYHFYYCNGQDGPWIAHRNVLRILEENPRLAESAYGRNYVEKTKEIGALFERREAAEKPGSMDDLADVDDLIEDMLVAGLGSQSIKYWDPPSMPRKHWEKLPKKDRDFIEKMGWTLTDDEEGEE